MMHEIASARWRDRRLGNRASDYDFRPHSLVSIPRVFTVDTVKTDLVLVKLDAARTALAEAKTIQETKKILDVAIAAEVYAKRQKLGKEAESYATSIIFEALRQLGERLKATPRNKGTRTIGGDAKSEKSGGTTVVPPDNTPTLAKLGIDKKTSKRAQDVAELTDSEFENVKSGKVSLKRAQTQHRQTEKRVKVREYTEQVANLPILQKIFNVLLADVPWQYSESTSTLDGATDPHYATMPIEKIMTYLDDTKILVADDAALFFWATNPHFDEALEVVRRWGFTFKTLIVWVKTDLQRPGVGHYVRSRNELLYICTRGSFTPLDKNITPPIGSVLEVDWDSEVGGRLKAPVGKHSEKPAEVYEIIERLYPDCVYLELFAKSKRKGWDCLGDES
jgi:N6-adenosine-specific RNA methylase IME4